MGIAPLAQPVSAQTVDPFALAATLDFREEMRSFIQSISAYGRSVNPRFVVVVQDGLDLVTKPDPEDDTQLFPARAFIRAIDGVMETGLLDDTVTTPDGKYDPLLDAKVKRKKANIAIAKAQSVPLLALDFATEKPAIDKLYADAKTAGLIPFVAENPVLNAIPAHPASAFSANPKFINAVTDAQNFLFVANTSAYGRASDLVGAMRNTNHDIVVIDVFHAGQPLSPRDIELIKYKKLGAKRLVLAQVDISTAAPFNYFWQPGWEPGTPSFIFNPVRQDPDRHRALYWEPAWQAIFAGDFNSFVYGAIDLGFDGVVIKGADAWKFFETGGEE